MVRYRERGREEEREIWCDTEREGGKKREEKRDGVIQREREGGREREMV